MADSGFKSKSFGSFRWIWLLLIVLVLGAFYALFRDRGSNPGPSAPGLDSSGMSADTANAGTQGLAANGPDWKRVDFHAPASADAGITDKAIRVSGNKDYTIYVVDENPLFNRDQSHLQKSGDLKLQQVASSINKRFESASIAVFVDTNTDEPGKNKQLGIGRAIAIKKWLLNNGKFAADDVTVQARGQEDPVLIQGHQTTPQEQGKVVIVAYRTGAAGTRR